MAATETARSAAPEARPSRLATVRRPTRGQLGLIAVTLAALTFYLVHALAAQAAYLTTGYDLGIFDQAVRAYADFQAPMVPLKGSGFNIYGDHFHPIITLLAPLYWLWNSPNALLVAQAVLTAASVPVVYRFTRRRASEGMSLVIAGAYAFGWPIQALIDFDFHEVAFATPLLALAIDALDRRDDRKLLLWCALLLLVREDMGVLVLLIGMLRLGQRRPNRPLVLALAGGGVLAYVLTTSLIIPHFAESGFTYGNQFGSLGPTVSAAALSVITRPWHAIAVFLTPAIKAKTLALLFLPTAMLPLRSPYVILAMPLLAERFFNTRQNLWKPIFHYNALPWLILVFAMVDGAARLGLFGPDPRKLRWRRALAGLLVATPIALIFVGDHFGVQPITKLRPGYAHQPATWEQDAKAATAQIPDDVCVAADNHVVPHLTPRTWTTVAQAETPHPDFYVIDMAAPDTGGNPPAPKPIEVLFEAHADGYRIVFRSGSFLVLRAADYAGPSEQCKPLGPGKSG